jgi:hypothetical protein
MSILLYCYEQLVGCISQVGQMMFPIKGLDEKESSLLHIKHNTTLSIFKEERVGFEQLSSPSIALPSK